MRYCALVLIGLLACCALGSSEIVEVTRQEQLDSGRVFLLFYSPTCGHCKAVKPHWAKLESSPGLKIAQVDCTANKEICKRYQISSYPQMYLLVDGKHVHSFRGERNHATLFSFAKMMTGISPLPFPSVADARSFAGWVKGPIVIFSSSEKNVFPDALVEELRTSVYFASVEGDTDIEIYRPEQKDKSVVFSGVHPGAIKAWILRNKGPLLAKFDKWTHASSGMPVLYLYLDSEEAEVGPAKDTLGQVADDLAEENILFCWIFKQDWDGVRTGHSGENYPAVSIVHQGKLNHHWAYHPENKRFDADEVGPLKKWVRGVLSGEVPRTIVSEPVPTNTQGFVRTVVGSIFQKEVVDRDSDVLVYFGSESCGNSKAFKPTWKKFAAQVEAAGVEGLTLMEGDGWANDWPDSLGITGLPDVRLFTTDDKQHPFSFAGDRTVEGLWKFVKDNRITDDDHDEL